MAAVRLHTQPNRAARGGGPPGALTRAAGPRTQHGPAQGQGPRRSPGGRYSTWKRAIGRWAPCEQTSALSTATEMASSSSAASRRPLRQRPAQLRRWPAKPVPDPRGGAAPGNPLAAAAEAASPSHQRLCAACGRSHQRRCAACGRSHQRRCAACGRSHQRLCAACGRSPSWRYPSPGWPGARYRRREPTGNRSPPPDGSGSRPAAARARARSTSCSRAKVASSRQAAKYPYTVSQGVPGRHVPPGRTDPHPPSGCHRSAGVWSISADDLASSASAATAPAHRPLRVTPVEPPRHR